MGVESSRLGLDSPLLGNLLYICYCEDLYVNKVPYVPKLLPVSLSFLLPVFPWYTQHNNVISIIHNNASALFWQSLSLAPGPWRQFPASLFLLLLVFFLFLVVARGNAPLAVSSRHLFVLLATLSPVLF